MVVATRWTGHLQAGAVVGLDGACGVQGHAGDAGRERLGCRGCGGARTRGPGRVAHRLGHAPARELLLLVAVVVLRLELLEVSAGQRGEPLRDALGQGRDVVVAGGGERDEAQL